MWIKRADLIRLFFVALLFQSSNLAWTQLYKWTDEKGNIVYSDTLPQNTQQGTSQLNKQGVVVKKAEPTLTSEQRKAKEEALNVKKEQEARELEQRRKDKALLNTYSNVKEIDLMRDRNIGQVDAVISSLEVRVKATKTRLIEYQQQAEVMKQANKAIPSDITQNIKINTKDIESLEQQIMKKRKEIEAIRAKAEEDKKRFNEISPNN